MMVMMISFNTKQDRNTNHQCRWCLLRGGQQSLGGDPVEKAQQIYPHSCQSCNDKEVQNIKYICIFLLTTPKICIQVVCLGNV